MVTRHPATRTISCACGLFIINFYVCREMFWTAYINQMGSIEAAFIGLARYIAGNFRDLTWFPLWYGGIPFQNSYPPLFHSIVALWTNLFHWQPALAYHFVAAFFYCIGPVALFLLCLSLSGSRAYSFFAGLMYSVLSPSAFVIPAIRREIGLLRPRRFQALAAWGEGPHVAGIALLTLSVLCLHRASTRRRPIDIVLCAVLFAATVLTNWLAAVALFAAGIAYICSTNLRSGVVALTAALLAYGLVIPWIPPSTVQTIRINAPHLGDYAGVYANMPRSLAIVAIAALVLVLAIRRLTPSLAIRFGAIFALLMAAPVLPAYWWKIYILPQPDRYQLEFELALSMLIVFAFKPVIDRVPRPARIGLAAIAILLAMIPAKSDRRFARYLLSPVKIDQTIEYQTAVWCDRNLNGRRVFASGSTQFWLNAFSDTQQVTGGFDNGVVNQVTRMASYQIRSGDGAGNRDAEISILWLKAMGAHAIAVAGPDTTQAYRDDRNPGKFNGVLPALWHQGGDTIFQVPQRSTSLARIVTNPDLVLRTPANGIDVGPLSAYVKALDNPTLPEADFRWTTDHSASIHSILSPDHVVSIQLTDHTGWHARINGAEKQVLPDGLGQMYVEPHCAGACSIELSYDGGAEMQIARWIAAISWALAAAMLALGSRSFSLTN
ncbi:MAG TPA: hypothetical protein VKR43_23195 [Bryobacteraceae bacterium]|nr:hypothetical protein [Bryobacteraceae bacterium]